MKLTKALAVAVLAVSPIVGIEAPAANAASTCYGETCTDLDPAQTSCVDDAITIWSTAATVPGGGAPGVGHLEMRYSASCHANWARFTPWSGFDHDLATFLRGDEESGSPWIWRAGVDDVPRGFTARAGSDLPFAEQTSWTSMITADGTTCMSVDLYAYGESNHSPEMPGGYAHDDIGTYEAGCIS